MLKIKNIVKRVSARDYINNYRNACRFIEYCKECNKYGTMWVCPPYRFEPLSRIENYKYVYIVGTKVFIDEVTRHTPTNPQEQKDISYCIMEETRKGIDGRLLGLEKQYPGSLVFFAGSCFLCSKEECTRSKGQECIFPEKARSSLEAYGFDIARTTSELLGITLIWSENLVLPEYFTLVSAVFSDHEIDLVNFTSLC